jgi:hypothetical protein
MLAQRPQFHGAPHNRAGVAPALVLLEHDKAES